MSRYPQYGIKDLKRDFPTDEICLGFIFDALHSRKCSCGGTYKQITGRKQFQCSKCRYQIAPLAGTIFHKSDTPLTLWFHAIWIFSCAKSGISSAQMMRQLGVTYKTAWRILSLIRKSLPNEELLGGIVESDIAYFGGKGFAGKEGKDYSKMIAKKSMAIAAIQRNGNMRVKVIPEATREETEKFMKETVEPGTALFTDKGSVYHSSQGPYERFSVHHTKKEFSRGIIHVNRVESFWNHVKTSMRGTFKSVSKQHLQSYLDAFAWHRNMRNNDSERFQALLQNVLQPLK